MIRISRSKKEANVLMDGFQPKSNIWFQWELRERDFSRGPKTCMRAPKKVQQLHPFLQISGIFASYLLCKWAVSLTTLHSAGKFSSHCHWEHMSCYKRRTQQCQFLHSAHWSAQGLLLFSCTRWLGPQGLCSSLLEVLKEKRKEKENQ